VKVAKKTGSEPLSPSAENVAEGSAKQPAGIADPMLEEVPEEVHKNESISEYALAEKPPARKRIRKIVH
jgi:hypothetical protein